MHNLKIKILLGYKFILCSADYQDQGVNLHNELLSLMVHFLTCLFILTSLLVILIFFVLKLEILTKGKCTFTKSKTKPPSPSLGEASLVGSGAISSTKIQDSTHYRSSNYMHRNSGSHLNATNKLL